jgi:small subunit ribosomal protein S6
MAAKMRDYETLCIVNPDIGQDGAKAIIAKARGIVEADGGAIHSVDEWGRKKLAYPIRKKGEGYYFLMLYKGTIAAQAEVTRVLKINEDVIRSQSIQIEEDDVKAMLDEATKARAAAAAAAQAAQAAQATAVAPAATVADAPTQEAQGGGNG